MNSNTALTQKILAFLRRASDGSHTYCEISSATGEDRHGVMRRLHDLRLDGLVEKSGVRTCSVSGGLMTTWRAK